MHKNVYKTGHKCKYSKSIINFKPDGNIYGLASRARVKNLHMEDEFQSYVLSFFRGLPQGSYATILFNSNYVQHFYTLYLHFVVRKGREQCSTEENITPHE